MCALVLRSAMLLHLRMLLLIFLILELRISDIRLVFQLGNLLIRLVDAAFPMMTEMPRSGLGDNLCFMRRLNRRVFLFDLMDFAVNAGSEGVTDLADVILCFKLQLAFALWLFQLILKMKAGFVLAGLFITASVPNRGCYFDLRSIYDTIQKKDYQYTNTPCISIMYAMDLQLCLLYTSPLPS